AQIVSSAPMPAQATIRPRLEMVENARTFLPSFWAMAIMLAAMKVKPPMKATVIPVMVLHSAGDRRMRRYTPALTMVALCSRALDGVGATMAPSSQEEKGSCADLVRPAKASMTTGMT